MSETPEPGVLKLPNGYSIRTYEKCCEDTEALAGTRAARVATPGAKEKSKEELQAEKIPATTEDEEMVGSVVGRIQSREDRSTGCIP